MDTSASRQHHAEGECRPTGCRSLAFCKSIGYRADQTLTPRRSMDSGRTRQALVVRGGWEGHSPVAATERFIPFLEEHGYAVEVHESPEVYADGEKLAATDLVVQCYTQGLATDE